MRWARSVEASLTRRNNSMRNVFFSAALVAALCLPVAAVAQQLPGSSSAAITNNAATAAMMATMVCRPIQGSEKSNAMMGTTAMMCRKVDMDKMHADMSKMYGAALTPDQKAAQDTFFKTHLEVTGQVAP